MFKKLLHYVGQYKASSIVTPIYAGLEVLMEMLIPYVTAWLIDRGITAGDISQVWKYGAIMLGLAFLSLLWGVLAAVYAAKASSGFGANLRNALYEKIQTFSFSNIDHFSTAGLITRMTTDVSNIQNAFSMILRMTVRAPLTLILSTVMCVMINRSISLIFLVALVVLAIALFTIIRIVSPRFQEVFHRYDDLNASVQENVSGIRVVKAFVREEFENSKFRKAAENLARLFIRAEATIALNGPIMMLVVYATIIGISWFGAQAIVASGNTTFTTGNLTSMFSYVMSALGSLMMVSMIFVMITMSMASGRRVAEVLDETPDITNPENPVTDVKDGSVDFNHVSFAYRSTGSGEDTLKDIDLHIRSGEVIGILGATGSGKSSLVNLISRLYDVKDGSVAVGGVDVRRYDIEKLRDAVSVVLQKNVLFSGTVMDNLRWGNEQATEEECREACRLACADEFLETLPDGYQSRVEQGGANFSGGQKQRLCIARALMKKPKVLILDDSTSACDTATDARIRKAFREFIPETTKLIIAQRIASVQDADRILVLENGRVAAFGSHDELMEQSAIYKEIYETQTSGGGDFDEAQLDQIGGLA